MKIAVPLLAATSALAGADHTVHAERFYNSFDHRHAVLARVKPGDRVHTRTIDAGGYDESGKKAAERPNPLTGPFYIEGAEPGDAVVVHIERLRMNRDYGWTGYRLGLWALDPPSIEGLYAGNYRQGAVHPDRSNIVKWRIAEGKVKLIEPESKVHPMEFAAEPMLGCIGVAPPGGFAAPSGISGPYGGNMDYNRIGEGATVFLPVYHAGGLLFVGDGHAIQGDGEPIGTGVETSMDVTLRVELRKGARLENPRVETAEWLISVGSQPEFVSSLDRSLRLATSDMVRWLTGEYKMEDWAAHLLIGYQGKYDVITVGGSMALRLRKAALPPGR